MLSSKTKCIKAKKCTCVWGFIPKKNIVGRISLFFLLLLVSFKHFRKQLLSINTAQCVGFSCAAVWWLLKVSPCFLSIILLCFDPCRSLSIYTVILIALFVSVFTSFGVFHAPHLYAELCSQVLHMTVSFTVSWPENPKHRYFSGLINN